MPKYRVMQGHVDEKAPTFFWLACCAEAPTQEQEKDRDTWRHSLAWRIKQETALRIHLDGQLEETDKVSLTWQAGTLHLLTAAPRTGGGRARMTFEPPAEEFGPTIMLVLDYIGPLVSVFGCLQKGLHNLAPMQWPGTGPVKAALLWDDGWESNQDEFLVDPALPPLSAKSFNALSKVIPPDFPFNLPKALDCIDAEQVSVLAAIRASDAPLHLVHALAGTGKSMIMQVILAQYVRKTREPNRFLLVTLRNRPLRHEFLETLLDNKVLEPKDVLFAGKLPDWLIKAGVTDNDEAHFEKQVMKLGPVEKANREANNAKSRAEGVYHTFLKVEYAGRPFIFEQALHLQKPLKRTAVAALRELWDYFGVFANGADEVLSKVSVLLTTTDAALKLYAGLASPNSPAARLLKQQHVEAILLDEIQRVPVETFLGLAMQTPTLCAFGDKAQKVIIDNTISRFVAGEKNPLVQSNILVASGSGPALAIDHLLRAVPGTPRPAELQVHELTETKRFGNPLAKYLARLYPGLCEKLKAGKTERRTRVQHIWYRASPYHFWNMQDIKHEQGVPQVRCNKRKAADAGDEELWRAYGILWHSPLFTTLALHILYSLEKEAYTETTRQETLQGERAGRGGGRLSPSHAGPVQLPHEPAPGGRLPRARFLLPGGREGVPCPMPRARRAHGPQRQVRLRPAAPPVPQRGHERELGQGRPADLRDAGGSHGQLHHEVSA